MKKRNVLLIILLLLCMVYSPSVFAKDIDGCREILTGVSIDVKIANAVHTVIVAIKIAVPVLLVIFGMLDLFKGITAQKEDEIKKGQSVFIKRLITAAIIFFVISIVQLIISFVASDEGGLMDCAKCFINGADPETGVCE